MLVGVSEAGTHSSEQSGMKRHAHDSVALALVLPNTMPLYTRMMYICPAVFVTDPADPRGHLP